MVHELLAAVVEVSSVGASGMQLKKPVKVPRPKIERTPASISAGSKKAFAMLANSSNPRQRRG